MIDGGGKVESALAWVGYIAEWCGRFIPRLLIIRSTHAGVKYRRGKDALPMLPGLHVYWPLVTEIEVIPVARQTHNLPSQSLLTKDMKRVVVSGVVVYSIKDIVATLSRNWDVSDTINDITMLAVTHVITSHTLDYLLEHLTDEVQTELTRVTRRKLSTYGVKVYRTALTDFAECIILKNIGGGGGTVLTHNMD